MAKYQLVEDGGKKFFVIQCYNCERNVVDIDLSLYEDLDKKLVIDEIQAVYCEDCYKSK